MCLLKGSLRAQMVSVSFPVESFDLLSPKEKGKGSHLHPAQQLCQGPGSEDTKGTEAESKRFFSHCIRLFPISLFCVTISYKHVCVREHSQITTFVESVSQTMAQSRAGKREIWHDEVENAFNSGQEDRPVPPPPHTSWWPWAVTCLLWTSVSPFISDIFRRSSLR